MEKFSYLKEGETVATDRVLTAVQKPNGLVSALDLTALSEEDRVKAERLYAQWKDEVLKPFNKQATAFKKANLQEWEAFAKENGLEVPPQVKHFKASGLTQVV